MPSEPIVTREIATLPQRDDAAHKGQVGRIAIVGGCDRETMMVGAPALAADAALSAGAGLVQVYAPESIRAAIATITPCATARILPPDADSLLLAASEFKADVLAIGPGLGDSMSANVLVSILQRCGCPVVLDADGLNLLSQTTVAKAGLSGPIVLTPHAAEAERLLQAAGLQTGIDETNSSRRTAACALADAYGAIVVLKGRGSVVTNGARLFVNETGNSGMATGGTGDVLTGVIAALIGQGMEPFEASVLGVYLHGLAGDFAAEELGRWSMTAADLLRHLAEAFSEHHMASTEQD